MNTKTIRNLQKVPLHTCTETTMSDEIFGNDVPIFILSGCYDSWFFCSSTYKTSFLDPALEFLVPRKRTDAIFGQNVPEI